MRPRSRRWVAAVLAVALVATMVGIVPAGAAPGRRKAPPKLTAKVKTASTDVVATKLDERLREAVQAAESDDAKANVEVDIAVLVKKGAAQPAGMTKGLKLRLHSDAFGDLYVGTAKVSGLVKIASGKDVTFLYENGKREAPIVPDSGGGGPKLTALQKRLAVARTKTRVTSAKAGGADDEFRAMFDDRGVLKNPIDYEGGSATGWHDVSAAGHNSSGAWDLGFTGAGVRVAVADDSADFAHPDLQGTQAIVTDPLSPYYGWPMALDPYSALLYAFDAYNGTSYVADGETWFSDTSATIDEPGGDWDGKLILTPDTSLSGTYHIGYLWDENYLTYGFGEYPLVLVADENTAGVYDTVYVDLDNDYDFTSDKPCTMASPISYADIWDADNAFTPDGYADISGGMVYWVADGTNQPPGVDFMFGGAPSTPGAGEMVCFMGSLNVDEDHGTLCSSNVVGQGITDGPSIYGDWPAWRTENPGTVGTPGDGIVQGAARDGELVAIADIYWNHFSSTITAYDYAAFGNDWIPETGDEIQVVSNSYGESDEDADGWDFRSRYITDNNVNYNDKVSYLFSTGNGAPGYGTSAPPSPATGISVGASTQMGAVGGWDSAYDEDQITSGDVIPWSNRGPSATGALAPDIVADGAYSSGAVPLNMFSYNGYSSWDIWGGTSRSCPVAAGNLALVYQAYREEHGVWPTYAQARQFLQNGARDLNYDTFVQGAGSIDAGRSASLAADLSGLAVSPGTWLPGDYAGDRYESFVQFVQPGERAEDTLYITNKGDAAVDISMTDAWYQESGSTILEITLDASEESGYDFNRPDTLTDLTPLIPAGTDLMVVRSVQDFADFAPTGAFDTSAEHNVARTVVYNWKDQDTSGDLWSDDDSNGFVNDGEIDPGEYMRFSYNNNFANTSEVRVQTPLDRMQDGIFLGLQHNRRAATDGATVVYVEISFWDRADMPWLSCPNPTMSDLGPGSIWYAPMQLDVPADAPVGIYEGQFRIDDGTNVTVVPVVINVAASDYSFEFGDVPGALDALMPNNTVFGGQDWNWRAESGDWRFFWTEGVVTAPLPPGASWLVHTTWDDRGGAPGQDTDLDTQLYGPAMDDFSFYDPATFGPYGLAKTGGSANTNIGAGIWNFQTNSGTTDEWVTGPLAAGANQVMIHNVVYDGLGLSGQFSGETGVIAVDPQSLSILSGNDSGAESIDFTTYDLDLTGAAAQAYGLTKRTQATHDITQSQTWRDQVTLTGAAYLDVKTACVGQDIDLYVYYSDDGGSTWSLVGASETSSGEEAVRIDMPADGLYEYDVYGFSVSGTQPFDLTVSSPMGDDLTLSGIPAGPIPAGGGFTLGVDWTKVRATLEEREGDFEGVVFLGPVEAPSAVQVPVTLHYPFQVESSSPIDGQTGVPIGTAIDVTLTKRVDEATLDDTTVYLMQGATPVPCTISYADASATITLTPVSPLADDSGFELFINGLLSVDGDTLVDSLVFATGGGTLAVDDSYATQEDTLLSVDAPGVLDNDNSPDADPITASLVADAAHGTLALATNGGFTYLPDDDWNGTDAFTYVANDGTADSNVATVSIVVSAVNDAPVAADDDSAVNEDTVLEEALPGVLGNDTDLESDPLTAVLVDGAGHGTLALSANGGFTYLPDEDWNGTDTFTYKANDGAADSNVATMSILVSAVNDAPVAVADAYSVNEDTKLDVAAPGVLGNDTDVEGNALESAARIKDVDHGVLTLQDDGSLTYMPDADWNGIDTFTYKANDGNADSEVATVTITVGPVGLATHSVAGTNRVGTAIEASRRAFPVDGSADCVLIATSLNWPDALGGSALAGAVNGPILLTQPTTLPADVLTEIGRLGADKAVILGGPSAVGGSVEASLKAVLGAVNVERIAGANRYETSRMIAARAIDVQGPGYGGWAFLATGANFPDALGASPLAAANGWPIYLVNPLVGADAVLVGALKSDNVSDALVLGGTTVVSAKVEADVKAKVPCDTVERLSGLDRYATAVAVATYGVDFGDLSWNRLAIATGENFPDALAGGVLQSKMESVMLLTPGANLDDQVAATLTANKLGIDVVHFLGGTTAVWPAVRAEVTQILQ